MFLEGEMNVYVYVYGILGKGPSFVRRASRVSRLSRQLQFFVSDFSFNFY